MPADHPEPATPAPGQPGPPGPPDPMALLRSRSYLRLLVLAAILGVPISAAAYGFLALVSYLQEEIFTHLPHGLGFSTEPVWWPLPVLVVGGVLAGLAIRYLPGKGGASAGGRFRRACARRPRSSCPASSWRRWRRWSSAPCSARRCRSSPSAAAWPCWPPGWPGGATVPEQGVRVLGAAGSFAAISTLLGSPITGAFLLMEASGLGGPMLGLVLLPGLLAAGIGSLIFIGLDSLTGLGTFSLAIPGLPPFGQPTVAEFGWAIVIGLAAALVGPAIRWLALLPAALRRQVDHARAPAGRRGGRRAGDHLRGGDRQANIRRAVLGAECARPADHPRRQLLRGRAAAAAGVQGARLRRVAEQLPGRAHLPGHVHRRGRGHRHVPPARAAAGRRRRHGHRRDDAW